MVKVSCVDHPYPYCTYAGPPTGAAATDQDLPPAAPAPAPPAKGRGGEGIGNLILMRLMNGVV